MIQNATDSVIEEIHRTREKISERFGGNVAAIAEDAARRQASSNRPVWKAKTPNKPPKSERAPHASC
jgi:hypothetical protein